MREALSIKTLIVILIVGIFLASSTTMPLVNAQTTQTSLTIAVSSPTIRKPFWSKCTIEATLKDEYGHLLPNLYIDFLYACEDHTHRLGTAKTDSNGVASLTQLFTKNETLRISAYFSGTTSYAQSSSEYVVIIMVDYTPYLVGGGILAVAIIGIAGYSVFRRRKTAVTMPKIVKEA